MYNFIVVITSELLIGGAGLLGVGSKEFSFLQAIKVIDAATAQVINFKIVFIFIVVFVV
jgi:hypothetical protein